MYFDRNATQSAAKRRGEQPVVEPTRAPRPVRRPADEAREGGIPGVFRRKRNDERRAATRFSRDGSPAEPPPGELGRVGFTTGCLAGMDRRSSPHRENWAAWVLPQAVNSRWGTPGGFHHRLSRTRQERPAALPRRAWRQRDEEARASWQGRCPVIAFRPSVAD